MKIIFLDYDGVLNNTYFLLRQKERGAENDFDPKKIEILKQVCDNTNAMVVVTSSWRFNERARMFLLEKGIPIYDVLKPDTGTRGEDIDLWLQETPMEIEKYVIFDDDTSHYSPQQMKHTICTKECFSNDLCAEYDCCMGLQDKHIKWAKAMLED
mgnify:CR=1 FL=1